MDFVLVVGWIFGLEMVYKGRISASSISLYTFSIYPWNTEMQEACYPSLTHKIRCDENYSYFLMSALLVLLQLQFLHILNSGITYSKKMLNKSLRIPLVPLIISFASSSNAKLVKISMPNFYSIGRFSPYLKMSLINRQPVDSGVVVVGEEERSQQPKKFFTAENFRGRRQFGDEWRNDW
ncbi:uncharacterized protein LOC132268543 [Cornus florida]|uniref:uncharacterized protein LOC132268543 n=1 Tax=Cornus florida TaxID=4283 RepID=UPI00289BEFD0|nr:uncharacterized protein LOC132268543 [Cornus florida]